MSDIKKQYMAGIDTIGQLIIGCGTEMMFWANQVDPIVFAPQMDMPLYSLVDGRTHIPHTADSSQVPAAYNVFVDKDDELIFELNTELSERSTDKHFQCIRGDSPNDLVIFSAGYYDYLYDDCPQSYWLMTSAQQHLFKTLIKNTPRVFMIDPENEMRLKPLSNQILNVISMENI